MGIEQTIGLNNGARREMEESWRFCRVLGGGTLALRKAREEFTPRTAKERDPQFRIAYDERLNSSSLHNVYEETIHRIASLPFEKPPTVDGITEPRIEAMLTDADRCGTSLSVFLQEVYQDALDRGLGCFLVDNVPTEVVEQAEEGAEPTTRAMTVEEGEALDARPYLSRIDPDNLVGWMTEKQAGREVLTELRVREWAYEVGRDGTERKVERIRLYTTTTVEVWQRVYAQDLTTEQREELAGKQDTHGYRLIEAPRPHGFPNNEIPLVVHYTRKEGFLKARPPFIGLAHLNIAHWNKQSILDTALRHNLNPILFGSGMEPKDTEEPPKRGEGAFLLTTSEKAALGYIEISGASLTIAATEIEKLEARMRSRANEPLQAGSATATGEVRAELRDQSEAQRWIEGCEWAAYRALELAHAWLDIPVPDDLNITLHRASSILQVANPARTTALQGDRAQRNLSLVTYLKERARSGDFADDFDPEAEALAVEQEAEAAVQRQMEALAANMIAQRGAPPGEPMDNDPDDEPVRKTDDEPEPAGAV